MCLGGGEGGVVCLGGLCVWGGCERLRLVVNDQKLHYRFSMIQ